MATLQDIDPRFRHLGKKVFTFIIIALVIIILAVYYLGKEKDLFAPRYHLHFTTNSAFGYSEGMSVKLAGFRIGKVSKITLDENAKVIIELEIKKRYKKWIRADSTASLKKEGYIGESFIEISFGSLDKPVLEDKGEIAFLKAKGLEDIAKEIVEELKPVALDVKNFVEYITNPKGDVTRILKNTANLTGELNNATLKVETLLEETRPVIKNSNVIATNIAKETEKLAAMTEEVKKSLENIEKLTKSLKEDIPQLINETKKVISNVNKITADVAKESHKIRPVIDNVQDISDDGKDITDSVKKNWLIKRNLPPEPTPSILMPSLPKPENREQR